MKKLEMNEPEAQSLDLVAGNIARLRELFPEAWTEGAIDFDVFKQLLGGTVEEHEEKYGLNWHGKRLARQIALTPSIGTLRPCTEESVDWDATKNLMIEGDNLEVLKLLQKSYAGRVKLIYIDPPYNTGGKDFVYPDSFRDSIDNYLDITGQKEGGQKRSSAADASGRLHTPWLNMMYPRVKLGMELLRPDGVMLVSINDVESARLRILMDELFGEENFLCQFVWNNEGNVDQQSKIKGVHEYILAYVKNLELFPSPRVIDPNVDEASKLYNEQIENSITKNGPANPPSEILLPAGFPATFQDGTIQSRDDEWPHILDEITVSEGVLQAPARVESGWSSRNLLELYIRNGFVPITDASGKETRFALTPTGAIYGYKRRSEQQGHVVSVIRNVGTTKQNSNMLAQWGISFTYPKPVYLIEFLISVFTRSHDHDIVLDYFAGSATTGHATYRLNASDGGNRRFVLVQLPEPIAGGSSEPQTLADLSAMRLSCAGDAVRGGGQLFAGDFGFRRLRLATSNIVDWRPGSAGIERTLLDSLNRLKADSTDDDILTEVILRRGLDLCIGIDERTISGKLVRRTADGALIACLAESIARADVEPLARGIIDWHNSLPTVDDVCCVFRDSAFVDDVAKTNLAAVLEQHGVTNVRSL